MCDTGSVLLICFNKYQPIAEKVWDVVDNASCSKYNWGNPNKTARLIKNDSNKTKNYAKSN